MLYAATDPHGAFIETFGDVESRMVSVNSLTVRGWERPRWGHRRGVTKHLAETAHTRTCPGAAAPAVDDSRDDWVASRAGQAFVVGFVGFGLISGS